MAFLYVEEFSDLATTHGSVAQVASFPANAQQAVAITSASNTSSSFKNNTRFIRLHSDTTCSVNVGVTTTATTTNARMAQNQTEYFQVPVAQGYQVAVIANS